MSDLRKAAQQALEALESDWDYRQAQAITALRAALAQPDPIISPEIKGNKAQPVAWVWKAQTGGVHTTSGIGFHKTNLPGVVYAPLYTHPPQRKPLTEEEIVAIAFQSQDGFSPADDTFRFARAIEKAHGIGGEHE
jgi:hypothetical protein